MSNIWGESPLYLGHQGENLARTKTADVSAWLAEWPEADFVLAVTLPGSVEAYIADTSVSGNTLSWPVTAGDTSYAGTGMAELRAYSGETLVKSDIIRTQVDAAMGTATGPVPPAAPDWVTEILTAVEATQADADAAAADAEDAASAAEAAAESAEAAAEVAERVDEKAPLINVSTESAAIASFPDGAAGLPMALTVGIEPVQAGSGDPSPTNVRPITGWTGCNVVRTGKNLLDGALLLDQETWNTFAISVEPNTQYTASCNCPSDQNLACYFNNTGASGGGPSTIVYSGRAATVTSTAEGKVWISQRKKTEATKSFSDYNYQIEKGSTATAYAPYTGTTLPVAFPSSAGTVYGGTLRIERDGSGTLTVDRAVVDMGTLTWTMQSPSTSYPYGYFTTTSVSARKPGANIICSQYKTGLLTNDKSIAGNPSTNRVTATDSSYSTAADFKTAMSGVQLCYELATPSTYTLTPGQVLSILGDNRVFADCGSTSVEYAADTKLYIDAKIAELQALILEN